MSRSTINLATKKQTDYIIKLKVVLNSDLAMPSLDKITKEEASQIIQILLKQKREYNVAQWNEDRYDEICNCNWMEDSFDGNIW